MSDKSCSNEVYSNLSYDKVREDNLKRTQQLYDTIFSEYSGAYSDYLMSQREVISNPANADAKNRSDAARVQKKPMVIDLNKQLVDIETELLNNNQILRKGIIDQQKLLNNDTKQRDDITKKLKEITKNIKIMEDRSDTGKYTIKDIQSSYHRITKWYYFFIALVVIFFIIFCILFVITLSSKPTSLGSNTNL
jgi:hypothetical protein